MNQLHIIFCHKYHQVYPDNILDFFRGNETCFAVSKLVNYLTNFKLDYSLNVGLFNFTYSVLILEEMNIVWRKPENMINVPHILSMGVFVKNFYKGDEIIVS